MTESNFIPPEVDALNESMQAYQFVSRIASSDSRAVYLAKHKSLDRRTAIKFYSPELSQSPEFRESFAANTKLMAKLKHPNLIGIYDSGLEQDMLYLVTEFVAGKPLWISTRGEPVDLKHVQPLIEGICVGMEHAHSNEICHGALSLKNILLDEKRMPKIGGFSQFSENASKPDPSGLRFQAPELADIGAKPTPQSDIYSIAMILREMAVGQTEGLEALGEIKKVGPALKRLVEKATSADPSKRHRKVEEFYEELLDAFSKPSPKRRAGNGRFFAAGGRRGRGSVGASAKRPVAATSRGGSLTSPAGTGNRTSTGVSSKVVMSAKPAKPYKWWLHLAIIIGLLIAIRLVWTSLQDEKNERNGSRKSFVEAPKELRVVHRPERMSKFTRDSDRKPVSILQDAGAERSSTLSNYELNLSKKDPADELNRLRFKLSRGSRSEMPKGTVELGNSYYHHVNIPMTWREAFWFAQGLCGHLAIPDSKATAEWMRRKLAADSDSDFWIGAAKSGKYSWTLADGRPWRPQDPAIRLGEYVAIGTKGQMLPLEGQAKRDFVIQWSKDGSNPGSLESLLEATKKSMSGSAPVYPPGTRAFGERHYLYVPKNINWKDAVLSARGSGGHLAVESGIAEKSGIEAMVKDLKVEKGIWLGGFHLDEKGWRWSTGESWFSRDWPRNKPVQSEDVALLIQPGGTWGELSRDEEASGYLIEWSEDHKKARR